MKTHPLLLITALLFSIASAFAQDCDHSGTAGNLEWCLKDSTLTISGEGAMPEYGLTGTPWYEYQKSISTVIIEAGVTAIENNGKFRWCENITSITVEDGNSVYTSEDGVLFDKNKTTLLCYPRGKTADTYVVPNGVTTIGGNAFYYCKNLDTITIPNSVTTIEHGAFMHCYATSINLPNSVTTIGNSAFFFCHKLTSINLPSGITTIEKSTFDCSGLTSITIPSSVTTIGERAFACSITSIIIPNGVTTIGDGAFSCPITSITIPSSVTSIAKTAFSGCSKLTSIDVENGNSVYASEDGVLFDKSKMTLIRCPKGKKGAYVIPNGVTTIGKSAFSDCVNLTSITIPNSVTAIGKLAFSRCLGLTSINLPESVAVIGIGVFYNCSNLTSITIPEGITKIRYGVFYECSGLTSVNLPSSVTSIEGGAFYKCSKLTSVNFYGSPASIAIPRGVAMIGEEAFYNCHSLTSITIPEGVTTIGKYAFLSCDSLTSITIPEGVTTIGNSAFFCPNLTSINLPNSLTTIGDDAFCFNNLTSITIPEGVTTIGIQAFSSCLSLISINIPSNVTTIGKDAFSWCPRLTSIDVERGNSVYTSVNGVLFDKNKTTLICCPTGKTDTCVIPRSVTTIGDEAFDWCSSLASIDVDSKNKVYASVNGVLYNKKKTTVICRPGGKTGSYVMPKSVTTIGNRAFDACHSPASIDVESKNKVYASVNGVLYNKKKTVLISCPDGKTGSYVIPDGVETIETAAFADCWHLTSITIPSSVTTIGEYAFRDCDSLTSIINRNPVPVEISSDVFSDVDVSTCTLQVPKSAVSAYQNAAGWKEFTIIGIEESEL